MQQEQPRPIALSIYRVWPLLIDGVARLNFKNDPHIMKVLNDLIVRWAPLLKISQNSKVVSKPFINVMNLKNPELIELVYQKLGKNFIALQNRKPSCHACMILTMVEEVMHVIDQDENKLMLLWRGIMSHVIEAAMMSDENIPSQIASYNLLERFMNNKNFETSSAMRDLVKNNLKSVTQSQLSYYSAFYFRSVGWQFNWTSLFNKILFSQKIYDESRKIQPEAFQGADATFVGRN